MQENRTCQLRSCFELGKKPVDVMDVFWPFDLRNHDDVDLVSDCRHDLSEVVEKPR
jgi:hypothetical protein